MLDLQQIVDIIHLCILLAFLQRNCSRQKKCIVNAHFEVTFGANLVRKANKSSDWCSLTTAQLLLLELVILGNSMILGTQTISSNSFRRKLTLSLCHNPLGFLHRIPIVEKEPIPAFFHAKRSDALRCKGWGAFVKNARLFFQFKYNEIHRNSFPFSWNWVGL